MCSAFWRLHRLGIISTPVIDLGTQTMYVVAMNKDSSNPFIYKHRLHALNIRTGEAKRPAVVIEGSVQGTGLGSNNGIVEFQSAIQLQRVSLTLHQGVIIIAFTAFCDTGPYHGWVFEYDANSLQRRFIWNNSPNEDYGGIWQSVCLLLFFQALLISDHFVRVLELLLMKKNTFI